MQESSQLLKKIIGFVEEITYTPFSVFIRGWMAGYDVEATGVQIYLDGVPATIRLEIKTSDEKLLEDTHNPFLNKKSWLTEIDLETLRTGVYTLTAFGVSEDGIIDELHVAPNATTLVITHQPEPFFQLGVLDHILQNPQTREIVLRGWACASDSEIEGMKVYLDGKEMAGDVVLNVPRPDVSDAYGWTEWKNTGWRVTLRPFALAEGNHDISVLAIGTGGKRWDISNHQRIKFVVNNRMFLEEEPLERGWVETAGSWSDANFCAISSWAASNDTTVVDIEIFVDSIQMPARVRLGIERKDVAFAFSQPGWENCGWRAEISEENLPKGACQLTAHAVGSNGKRWNLQVFRTARCIEPPVKSLNDPQATKEIVQSIYSAVLFRLPTDEELDFACQKITADRSFREFITHIIKSKEVRKSGVLSDPQQPFIVSQSIFEEEKLVFLHVPKTGGVSFHQLLAKGFTAKEICVAKNDAILSYPLGALTQYKFFSGHFNMQTAKLIPGRKKIVTMLREPTARLISLYHYIRAHKPEYTDKLNKDIFKLASDLNLAEFFRSQIASSRSTRLDNDLIRSLTGDYTTHAMSLLPQAVHELENLTAFGILERFDDSVELVFDALDKPKPDAELHVNRLDDVMRRDVTFRSIQKESLTDDARQAMSSFVEADTLLYQHALALFDQRLNTLRQTCNH